MFTPRARTIRRALLGATSLLVLATTASAEDFDASRLPRPTDAKIVFSGAPVTNFTVPGKVADAADAINKLILADRWQPFVAPFSSNPKLPDFVVTRFKKGTIAMEVDISIAPAMSNATFVSYTGLINQNDLPFPADATDIQFDSARPYLACVTSAGIDDTLKFFTAELATRGWTPRPENARPDRKSDKGAYATFTGSENRGLLLTLKRGDDGRLGATDLVSRTRGEGCSVSGDRAGARCPDGWQSEFERICGRSLRLQRIFRNAPKSAQQLAPVAPGWFKLRFGGSRGERNGGRGLRDGHGRLYPGARRLVRDRRVENDAWFGSDRRRIPD